MSLGFSFVIRLRFDIFLLLGVRLRWAGVFFSFGLVSGIRVCFYLLRGRGRYTLGTVQQAEERRKCAGESNSAASLSLSLSLTSRVSFSSRFV